jgi:hypothetical protein
MFWPALDRRCKKWALQRGKGAECKALIRKSSKVYNFRTDKEIFYLSFSRTGLYAKIW